MDPALAMLSNQTATSRQYSDEDVDYDRHNYQIPQDYAVPQMGAPIPQMAAPVPVQRPHYQPEQQLFRTQAVNYARLPAPVQPTLYLAQACGNCARSYGVPLVCAALKTEVSPLSVCENFSSPLDFT